MRYVRIQIVLFLLFFQLLFGQLPETVQLVESVPAGTSLGIEETGRTLPVWLEMIGSAQKSIDMEIFYLSHKPGTEFDAVIQALIDAANRGVDIRIIADADMAETYPNTLHRLNELKNIEVRRITYFNRQHGIVHAKYFIVDGRDLFLGSQNMDWRAVTQIHELGVRVRNEKLAGLIGRIFSLDWKLASGKTEQIPEDFPGVPEDLRLNAENPLVFAENGREILSLYPTFSPKNAILKGMEWDETAIIGLIDKAREQIEIQLLSYKPESRDHFYANIDNALRRAAARGVEVRMIVSNWNTRFPGIQFLKSLQVVPHIEIKISSIPQPPDKFIPYGRVEHCKYLIVDHQQVWLGTSNWSYGYFHNSRNLGLVFSGKAFNGIVTDVFEKSWNSEYCRLLDVCREYIPPKVGGEEGQ